MNSRQRRKKARAIRDIWQGVPIDISNNALTSQDLEAGFERLKADHGKLLITDVDHTNKIVTVQYVK